MCGEMSDPVALSVIDEVVDMEMVNGLTFKVPPF